MSNNPYRAPEMDPNIRIRDLLEDDHYKPTNIVAALFFAAALLLGLWLLYLGSTYGPSSMVQEPTIFTRSQVN